MRRARVFITHGPRVLAHYYGPRAQAALEVLADVRRCTAEGDCTAQTLAEEARDCDVIVSDRRTPCDAALLERLPSLLAVCRCAVDIRNIDVAAASTHGVLVTQASAGFMASVSEWIDNLIDSAALAAMKRSAFFINASRGELVDEAALLDALDSGRIAGCALDVGRAPDQMPSPALARHPRVIATPHIGGLTPPAIEHQSMETVQQVSEILQGRVPAGAVNAPHAARLRSRAAGQQP